MTEQAYSTPEDTQAKREASRYMNVLYHHRPDPSVIVVTPKDHRREQLGRSHFCLTPESALDYVVGAKDVYIRVTVLAHKPKSGRGSAADSIALPGVWVDLDVTGTPGANGNTVSDGFPDVDTAATFASGILEPTLLVASGGGVQAYWLFDRMWVFDNAEDRERAASLVQRFQARLREDATRLGVTKLDPTHDLSHILRPPGSVNGKLPGEPRPVTLLQVGKRHDRPDIDAVALPESDTRSKRTGPDRKVKELLAAYPSLARIAHHEGKAPRDASDSGWDNYMTCEGVRCGLSDTELEALIHYARKGDLKSERTDYIERTIDAARATVQADEADPARKISYRWGIAADPIVSGETSGDIASGNAIVMLTRRSGKRLRFPKLGDLFEYRAHTRLVSQICRSEFPPITSAEAVTLTQLLIRLCGGEDDDPLQEARQWITDFVTGLGDTVNAKPYGTTEEKWDSLKTRKQRQAERRSVGGDAAARSVAMRDDKGELWLPGHPLKSFGDAKMSWSLFTARLTEIGWRRVEVDMWEPGVPRKDADRAHTVFYVGRYDDEGSE